MSCIPCPCTGVYHVTLDTMVAPTAVSMVRCRGAHRASEGSANQRNGQDRSLQCIFDRAPNMADLRGMHLWRCAPGGGQGGGRLECGSNDRSAPPPCVVFLSISFWTSSDRRRWRRKGAKKLGRHLPLHKRSAEQRLSANPDRAKRNGPRRVTRSQISAMAIPAGALPPPGMQHQFQCFQYPSAQRATEGCPYGFIGRQSPVGQFRFAERSRLFPTR